MLVLLTSLAYSGMPHHGSKRTAGFKKSTNAPVQEPIDAPAIYPEKRLWIAIILNTVYEYEDQLKVIQKLWGAGGSRKALSKHFLTSLRSIEYEVRHEWFNHVCDLADFDQARVIRKLKELDTEYKLSQVTFAAEDHIVTRYQVRMSKLRHA
mgnify:CR=1 FL=1